MTVILESKFFSKLSSVNYLSSSQDDFVKA